MQRDHENSFCDAKILTDLRPVFGASAEVQPEGIVVTHTLKLEYHDDRGAHRKFYVALNQDDLETLRNVLERADKKANSLQALSEFIPENHLFPFYFFSQLGNSCGFQAVLFIMRLL